MPEQAIGHISAFFARPVVAGLDLTAPLRVGDRIHIKGHTTDIALVVESMQVNNRAVQQAAPGEQVGVKVPDRVRPGDTVYLVTD
ncbi:MAG: translation elongation factor-like protein [Chloroflexi bacterium]|nr:translation elongation factor-like protein [Chloroflexota bacterium]